MKKLMNCLMKTAQKESLDYLKEIYEYLCRLGLSDKVIIDWGL